MFALKCETLSLASPPPLREPFKDKVERMSEVEVGSSDAVKHAYWMWHSYDTHELTAVAVIDIGSPQAQIIRSCSADTGGGELRGTYS